MRVRRRGEAADAADGAPPITLNLPTSRETQACYADLSREGVRYSPLPDRDYGGGCQVIGAVQLLDIGVPVTGIKAMRCGLAEEFIGWTRNARRAGRVSSARQHAGADRDDGHLCLPQHRRHRDRRGCRGTRSPTRSTSRRSSSPTGAASSVKDGWRSDDADVQRFWKLIHTSACKRFGTVLSPDYNAAHYNHLHLEDDRRRRSAARLQSAAKLL